VAVALAEVLRRFGPEYLGTHALSTAAARAWRDILACRTPALGGQLWACSACGAEQWRWHSCGNRHCPRCGSAQREAWRAARQSELLDVPYCHLVFTLPHELNALGAVHPRWVYATLMQCAAATLSEFAANPRWLGGVGAFTLVLHTWTQDLRRHIHVHALMACGALTQGSEGARWVAPQRSARFLFPVHALSRVLRAKFCAALAAAQGTSALPRDPAATAAQRSALLSTLRGKAWVVYAKTPLAGPVQVLDYLSRYTRRSAIGAERLLAIEGAKVVLRVRRNARNGKPSGSRTLAIEGVEFIARFMQHVQPLGFKRIRHYGLLAPAAKARLLPLARWLLRMPPINPRAAEDAQAFMRRVAGIDIERCTHCNDRSMQLRHCQGPDRQALAALWPCLAGPLRPHAPCRAPP
jgi:hypothetical protein